MRDIGVAACLFLGSLIFSAGAVACSDGRTEAESRSRTEACGGSGIELEVVPVKGGLDPGDEIEVDLVLRNSSTESVALYPFFHSPACIFDHLPQMILSFEVQGMDREDIASTPPCPPREGHEVALPEQFLVLGPGEFFGRRINLTSGEFGYLKNRRGEFRVKALLQVIVKDWLADRSVKMYPAGCVLFDDELVFEGDLTSCEVVVQSS